MSFATDIYHLMTNDPSINAWCDGGIRYENLPENFEIFKNWIVYSFNKNNTNSCLSGSVAYTNYNVAVKVVAKDTLLLETISDKVVSYLNGRSYTGIQDITFLNDNHSLDLDKKIYMNTMSFDALYSQ